MKLENLCREMYNKDVTDLTREERIAYVNELGKHIRAGERSEYALALLLFGKKFKSFNAEEKSFYTLYIKNNYMICGYVSLNKRVFNKKIKDLTKEEKKLLQVIRIRERNGIDESQVQEMFHKSYNELTSKELVAYHKAQHPRKRYDSSYTSTVYQLFGKKTTELTPDEKREYNRYIQEHYRKSIKEN